MTSLGTKPSQLYRLLLITLFIGFSHHTFAGPLSGYSWVGAPLVVKTSTARHAGDNGVSCGSDFEMCIGQVTKTTGGNVDLKTVKCFIPKNTVTCPTDAQLDTLTGERRCVVASNLTAESGSNNACREAGGPSGPCYCRAFNLQKDSSRDCYDDLARYRRSHNCSKIGTVDVSADDVTRCRWACSSPHASTEGNCALLQCEDNATRQTDSHSEFCRMATWRRALTQNDCQTHFASSAPNWNPETHKCQSAVYVQGPTSCPGRTVQVSASGPCVNFETYCANVGVGPGAGKRYCSSEDTCYMVVPKTNPDHPQRCAFGNFGTPCGFPLDCYHPITVGPR